MQLKCARLRQYWYKYLVENIWHFIEDKKSLYVLHYYCIVQLQMNYIVRFHLQYTWNLFGVLMFMNIQLTCLLYTSDAADE